MKKIIILCFISFLFLLFDSCSNGKYINEIKFGNEQANEILRCFDENDKQALKSLFCEQSIETYDIDKEIEEAMSFYVGKCIGHDNISINDGGKREHGVIVDSHIEYLINNIKTDKGSEYTIVTHSYIVYQRNPKCVGITYLKVINNGTDEMVQIGEYVY